MARTLRVALVLAIAVSLLVAAAPAFALDIEKVTGGVTLQDANGLQAKAVVQAWESWGTSGTPEYRPAHGTLRMWIGGTDVAYELDQVMVSNSQAMFGGMGNDGVYRRFYMLDGGESAVDHDVFVSRLSGMLFFQWQITGGNMQVHEY